MNLKELICGILVSICESNVTKDKIKDHVIRLLGGTSRTVIDGLKQEILHLNHIMEDQNKTSHHLSKEFKEVKSK